MYTYINIDVSVNFKTKPLDFDFPFYVWVHWALRTSGVNPSSFRISMSSFGIHQRYHGD